MKGIFFPPLCSKLQDSKFMQKKDYKGLINENKTISKTIDIA